ncbi:LytR/AlgR family response regulator transcription factor [Arcticibacterium luteifluviistationis]|uniref:HTH LytTR-type domain-containing protein n=1 Tax=Arcticibacterium luteifluviistationis TaxID=1784714 RepID=A0A2Z4GGG7_9BACT|nr:LytTR family DNA-binding domain-containing protein [Arcticibacterium luteifluviistationis]AWW00039.1 hypothetical protein DJ013_18435 [Arcticibacterium luteifluviistationis]
MKAIINILYQKAPYLDSTRNKLFHIGFLSIFTAIFLSVYSPFNMSEWGGSILGYVLIGTFVSFTSQFLLRYLLGLKHLRLYQLIFLAGFELTLITLLLYLIYGVEYLTIGKKIGEFLVTLKFVCLILMGPYLLSVWFLAGRQKPVLSNELSVNNDLGKNPALLSIKSDTNKVLLAIRYDQILLLKSSGNYVDIYYLKGEKVTKELVRISLKELESIIQNTGILRIHRSYLVNKHMISSFKKTRKGYDLIIKHIPEDAVPVSSGYKESFEEALALKLSH